MSDQTVYDIKYELLIGWTITKIERIFQLVCLRILIQADTLHCPSSFISTMKTIIDLDTHCNPLVYEQWIELVCESSVNARIFFNTLTFLLTHLDL